MSRAWHVSTLVGGSVVAGDLMLYLEAALLVWLDERTERGFEVCSDQLASGLRVWQFCL